MLNNGEKVYIVSVNDMQYIGRLSYKGIQAYLKLQGFQGTPGKSVNWKGTWSSGSSYSVLDMVNYNGQVYIAKSASTNKVPTNTTYWDLACEKGSDGEIGLNWLGAWDSGTSYVVGDGVSNDGSSYICNTNNTNQEPPNASYWDVLALAGSSSFDIHGLTAKTTPVDNDEIPIADSEDSYNNKKILFSKIVPSSRTVNSKALSGNITLNQDDIGDGTTYKQYSATEKSKLSGIEANADVTDLTNVSSSINGASAATPVDADKFSFVDADDNTIKTVTGANLKTFIGSGSGDITKDAIAAGTTITTIQDTDVLAVVTPGTPNILQKIAYSAFKTLMNGLYALTGHNHDSSYVAKNTAISGDTKTKITYDAKGLVTSGAAATQDDIGDGTTYKQYSSTEKSKLSGIEASADVTDLTNVSSSINGASAVTPVDADKFPFVDADDNTIKTVTGSNLKTYIGAGGSGDITKDELAAGTTVTDITTGAYVAITRPGTPNTIEKITKASLTTLFATDVGAAIDGASALTTLASDDKIAVWDESASELKTITFANFLAQQKLEFFPVGSRVTYDNTTSDPNTLIGGTWERIGAGKFDVGYDSTDTDFDTPLETGGAKTKAISAHTGCAVSAHGSNTASYSTSPYRTMLAPPTTHTVTQADNHTDLNVTPPYIVWCHWRRTA